MMTRVTFLMISSAILTVSALAGSAFSIARNTPTREDRLPMFPPPTRPDRSAAEKSSETEPAYLGAVGVVEPAGELVEVGTQRSGIVRKIFVRPGDTIREGDPLILLDDRAARAEVASRQAEVAAAEAVLRELCAQVAQKQAEWETAAAEVKQALVERNDQRDQMTRSERLLARGAVSPDERIRKGFAFSLAETRVNSANAKLKAAKAALQLLQGDSRAQTSESVGDTEKGKPSGATIGVQEARIASARAALELARTELDLLTIRAPMDAAVLQTKIHPGEYAQASPLEDPLMVLGDTSVLHIRAELDEAEIPRFSPCTAAYASPRGNPSARLPLRFVRVEPLIIPKRTLNGSVSERVDTRVLQVIYAVAPAKTAETTALPSPTPSTSPAQSQPAKSAASLPTLRTGQQVDLYISEQPLHPNDPTASPTSNQ